jgi:hypothetical protein
LEESEKKKTTKKKKWLCFKELKVKQASQADFPKEILFPLNSKGSICTLKYS